MQGRAYAQAALGRNAAHDRIAESRPRTRRPVGCPCAGVTPSDAGACEAAINRVAVGFAALASLALGSAAALFSLRAAVAVICLLYAAGLVKVFAMRGYGTLSAPSMAAGFFVAYGTWDTSSVPRSAPHARECQPYWS